MLLSQWGRAAAQIVSLIALARLLAPSDYGLVAMTAAITGLAVAVGDFGLSLAAIQAPVLTGGQRSNLFWLNALLGLVGGGAIAASAPLIAAFYDEPRLQGVALALAAVFVLNGCSTQFIVELNRSGRFGAIGGVQLGAQVLAVVAAIIAAAAGAGYRALVLQQLLAATAVLLGAAIASRWRPGLPDRSADIRPLLRFGGGSLASQILAYVTSNLDSVLIGRHFAPAVLGLYNRAFTVAMLPVAQVLDPLTRVVLPRLAATADERELDLQLRRVVRAVSIVALAPLGLLVACGPQILAVVLGPEWAASGQVLRVLAIAAVLQSANYLYYWAFMSRGRTGLLFVTELPGKAVIVVLLFLFVSSGPLAVAAAVATGGLVGLVGAAAGANRIGLRNGSLVRAAALPLTVNAAASAAAFAAASAAPPASSSLTALALGAAAWAGTVLLAVAAVPGLRRGAVESIGRVVRRVPRATRQPEAA